MNDAFSSINWKKIKRLLPTARRYALDRIPTEDEVRKIVEASDIRGKALTLLLVSSGIREGAVESLKVGDLTPVVEQNEKEKNGKDIMVASSMRRLESRNYAKRD